MRRKKILVMSFVDAALCGLNIALFRVRGNPLNLIAAVFSGAAAFYGAYMRIKLCKLDELHEELTKKLEALRELHKLDEN